LTGLRFAEAGDEAHRAAALDVIAATYQADLGHVPVDRFDHRARFLVALAPDGGVVGALRYLPPSAWPFDLGEFVDISSLLPADRVAGMLGRMSVRRGYRRVSSGNLIQMGLFRLACGVALSDGVSDLLIYSFDELARVYQSLGFLRQPLAFFHPVAKRRMSVLSLDLRRMATTPSEARSDTENYLMGIRAPNRA